MYVLWIYVTVCQRREEVEAEIKGFPSLCFSLLFLFGFVQCDGWTPFQAELDARGYAWSRIYTVLFIFIGNFIFTNLFIGVIIDVCKGRRERKKGRDDVDDDPFLVCALLFLRIASYTHFPFSCALCFCLSLSPQNLEDAEEEEISIKKSNELLWRWKRKMCWQSDNKRKLRELCYQRSARKARRQTGEAMNIESKENRRGEKEKKEEKLAQLWMTNDSSNMRDKLLKNYVSQGQKGSRECRKRGEKESPLSIHLFYIVVLSIFLFSIPPPLFVVPFSFLQQLDPHITNAELLYVFTLASSVMMI